MTESYLVQQYGKYSKAGKHDKIPTVKNESTRIECTEEMESEKRKILVVDDNLELAKTLARFLELEGFEVAISQDGYTALTKVMADSQELVLLDLKLPDMTGMEILEHLLQINEEIAVIVITGYGGEQVAVDLMKAGAVDFLSKPIEHRPLIQAVKNALRMRDARLERRRAKDYSSLYPFFPFLAHEIRNPLQAISGALAIIEDRSDLKDKLLLRSVNVIKEETRHLNEFVQECLDFVQPLKKGDFTKVDINEVLSVVHDNVSHMFEGLSQKIEIRNDLDPSIPKIEANYDELKKAFLNILRNSYEAMVEGGDLILKTSFEASPPPGWIKIAMTDHGPGIKEEDKKHLFNPFFTTKPKGTGLGLAICHRIIVERHGGKIEIEGEEGKGPTVNVILPIRLLS